MTDYEYAVCIYRKLFYEDADTDIYIRGILDAIETLTDREQAALECCYRYNMSCRQTAEKLGVSGDWAQTIINKALRKLRHPSRTKSMNVTKIIERHKMELESKDSTIDNLYSEIENLLKDKPVSRELCLALEERKMKTAQMGFTTRTFNLLLRAGLFNVESLLALPTLDDLEEMRYFGNGARTEIITKMREHGYVEWADKIEQA